MRLAGLGIAVALVACRDPARPVSTDHAEAGVPRDAITADAGPIAWPALEGYPRTEPVRVIPIPAQSKLPRFEVGGPVIVGDLAIVASSQLGFAAVDWRRGGVVWTKPTGSHLAPPLVLDGSIVLVGDCFAPPAVPPGESLVGCVRVVTPGGTDQAYLAIHAASEAVAAFTTEVGPQSLWREGDRAVRWRRGDAAITIDLRTGRAALAASVLPPPFVAATGDRRWSIAHDAEGLIVATGSTRWQTRNAYTAVLGIVTTPDGAPLVRVMNAGAFGGLPELQLIDIDATGSMRAHVARPTPGIALLGSALSSIGDAAVAVRLDTSLQRDVIAGYAANALLMWVYPLPETPRADPVGVAIAPSTPTQPGAVVVFHDGDTLTILPELSAPPTAPGAARAPSEIPTP